jgi:hypothetical protein
VKAAGCVRGLAPRIRAIRAVLKEFAPYVAIELILPGLGACDPLLALSQKTQGITFLVNHLRASQLMGWKSGAIAA